MAHLFNGFIKTGIKTAARAPQHRITTCLLLILVFLPLTVLSSIKPRYGGSLKVARELLNDMTAVPVFTGETGRFLALSLTENSAALDLSRLPDARVTEIEQSVQAMKDPLHPCHWILDYPYLDHRHPNALTVEKGVLRFETTDPEFLQPLLGSSCLMTDAPGFLLPFRRTQFAYEANGECLVGRPFLDSLTPVAVDPINPYLSFKLRDVDVFSVPEDRYRQIQEDSSLTILPGPEKFLYLRTEDIDTAEARILASAMNLEEIAANVLNGHATVLHRTPPSSPNVTAVHAARFDFPTEHPYRLVAERLRLQMQDAGVRTVPSGRGRLELMVRAVSESDEDLIRYRILREDFGITNDIAWPELWRELEAKGTVIPLLIYHSQIAVPKSLTGLARKPGGVPDFSSCWFQPTP